MNLRLEPPDHAVGRSRGGLSTKIHQLVDGCGLPLVVLVGAGQANDSPVFPALLAHLRVARLGPGRPQTRPDRLRADKAYPSRGNRALLRERGIVAVIPQPSDRIAHRQRRGSHGGRPPAFDPVDYRGRNVVERGFNDTKQWRALATLHGSCRYQHLSVDTRLFPITRATGLAVAVLSGSGGPSVDVGTVIAGLTTAAAAGRRLVPVPRRPARRGDHHRGSVGRAPPGHLRTDPGDRGRSDGDGARDRRRAGCRSPLVHARRSGDDRRGDRHRDGQASRGVTACPPVPRREVSP